MSLDGHAVAIGIVAVVAVRYLLVLLAAVLGWGETADREPDAEAPPLATGQPSGDETTTDPEARTR